MTLTLNKPLQFFAFVLSVFMILALMPQQADARKGNRKGGGTRTSVNRSSNRNVNVNKNSNRNTNVNVNRNKNVNVDVNVDRRGRGHHHHHNNRFWTGVAVGVTTAVVVGAIVSTLPTGCTTIIQNGISYQQCGTVRYQPQYSGNNVTYIVVK